jgi:multiple sugar transport system substrate-binding protein
MKGSWTMTMKASMRVLLAGATMLAALMGLSPTPARAEKTGLTMIFWTFQAEAVQRFIEEFMKRNPNIEVKLDGAPSGEYNAKAALMFRSKTPFDVLYVRDATLIQWVENGWIQPIDDCPGMSTTIADMLPFAKEVQSYKGKTYGLTYFAGLFPIILNTKMMKDAGFNEAPKTFEGWIEQAKAVKQKGIVEYPLSWPIRQSGWGGMYVWASMAAAKGGKLFDNDMNPTAEALWTLKWWRQTFIDGLSNPANIGWDHADTSSVFMEGKSFMLWSQQLYVGNQFANNPAKSKVVGQAAIVATPVTGKTVGLSAMYGINAATKNKEAACKLVSFLGGKDESGKYITPGAWVEAAFLMWGQRGVEKDPQVRASIASWGGNTDDLAKQLEAAVAMSDIIPYFKTTWYFEWQETGDKILQEVLSGQIAPEEGLKRMSDRAKQLARRYQAK